MAVGGVLMDRLLCRPWVGRWAAGFFWDALSAPTALFLGCDLCFYGLYRLLVDRAASRPLRSAEGAEERGGGRGGGSRKDL